MKKSWILALGAAAALAGCGGGGDDAPPATQSVPPGASASAGGFVSYLKALVASSADALEPVDVSAVAAPPADDAGEPSKVD
jgi:hypothetical protein